MKRVGHNLLLVTILGIGIFYRPNAEWSEVRRGHNSLAIGRLLFCR